MYRAWQGLAASAGMLFFLTASPFCRAEADGEAQPGEIRLGALPPTALLWLDGEPLGLVSRYRGPGKSLLVAPGQYFVRIRVAAGHECTVRLHVAPNKIAVPRCAAPTPQPDIVVAQTMKL